MVTDKETSSRETRSKLGSRGVENGSGTIIGQCRVQ